MYIFLADFSIFVVNKRWITERTYTELFGITQSLPGPGNAGFSWCVALIRNGLLAAILSFFVWTAPSLWIYIGVAIGLATSGGVAALPGWAVGIENGAVGAAVGIVSLAAFRLTSKVVLLEGTQLRIKPDMTPAEKAVVSHNRNRRVFAVACCTITLLIVILVTAVWIFPVVMVAAGIASFIFEYGHENGYWAKATEWKEKHLPKFKPKAKRKKTTSSLENGVEVTDKKSELEPARDEKVEMETGVDLEKRAVEAANNLGSPMTPVIMRRPSLVPVMENDAVSVTEVFDLGCENGDVNGNLHRRKSHAPSSAIVVVTSSADDSDLPPDLPPTSPLPLNTDLAITFTGHTKQSSPPLAPYFPATKKNMIPLALIYIAVLVTGFACKFGNLGGYVGALYGMCVVMGVITFGGWGSILPILTAFAIDQNGFITSSELTFLVALQSALPGPLFNIAGFIGAMAYRRSSPAVMALAGFLSYLSIFAPGMLLFSLVTPSYAKLREHKASGWIFSGINSAATGLMFQAIYIIAVKSIAGRSNGTSILGYPVFLGLAIVTFAACCDFAGDGGGGINPVWMILIGATVGVIEWAIVVR